MSSKIIRHLTQLATPQGKEACHGQAMNKLLLTADAAVWMEDGIIRAAGRDDEVVAKARAAGTLSGCEMIDGSGQCAVPGFVDPHTHFLFAGARAEEFDDRLAGVPYLTLLQRGGGIVATMDKTRRASEAELMEHGRRVLRAMLAIGVTTVEGKSGYGLDRDTELRLLHVLQQLDDELPTTVIPTYLGAHAVPPEYREHPDDYVDFMISTVLPQVASGHLADFVDVFCETGVFSHKSRKNPYRSEKARPGVETPCR